MEIGMLAYNSFVINVDNHVVKEKNSDVMKINHFFDD